MKRHLSTLAAAAALAALAACGSSSDSTDSTPKTSVTDLAAGVYAVSIGDTASPVEGKYYAAADGSRLVVFNNSSQQASQVFSRAAGASWLAIPATGGDSAVTLNNNVSLTSKTLAVADYARSYTLRLSGGTAAAFTIGSGGDITAGSTACKVSGKVTAGTLPNTLALALTTSGCGDLPAQSSGVLLVDSDYAPATFRLLTYSGSALVDLWAYAE
ncbi:hypothetical protein GJ699_15935 [Duganella sp. FT80W]|uniref:Uncharacterized protein n=1 Tax=Duganella guangzhouensis TaxID=2666084 RepID=A0A6I2L0V2_9BURK|nr:hypothetical protein [Duganella guangzhouensis]MRW91483.1 hypothetical protein [Duganella guangzhouensis]